MISVRQPRPAETPRPARWYARLHLQVPVAITLGGLLGRFAPATGGAMMPLGDGFTGIGGMRDLASVVGT